MRKRTIALLVAFVILLGSGGTVLASAVHNMAQENKKNAALKAEKSKAPITTLFHDQGYIYMDTAEPEKGEKVTLRLRTDRYNVTRAQIQYTVDGGVNWTAEDMEYEKKDSTGAYDLWKGTIVAGGELTCYRFLAGNSDNFNTVYFDTKGTDIKEGNVAAAWRIIPGHKSPDWAKGALWYSLVPDSFYNGNTTNDKQYSGSNSYASWSGKHRQQDDRYGGDLKGVIEKLDYIKSLGVDAVYINPITKSYHNVGYNALRFDEVESAYGNEEDLALLGEAVHKYNMKLMGDVVITFAGIDSYYFNKSGYWPVTGAYQSKDSEWFNLFKFFKWPDNFMMTWSSPAVNHNTDASQKFFYSEKDSYLQKYLDTFDGYRFDCGGWLWGTGDTGTVKTSGIVQSIRSPLKEAKADTLILAEADMANMNTGAWDAQWNTHGVKKLQDYANGLVNESIVADELYTYELALPRSVALCCMNMLGNHDNQRVVQDSDFLYNAAVLVQMNYLGSPSIYYGDEINNIRENESGIGSTGSYYAMEWDETNWDKTRLNFYKALSELRGSYSCVKTGVIKNILSDTQKNLFAFGRWDADGAAITVASQNKDVTSTELEVRQCDIKDGTVMTDWLTGQQYTVADGKITADIIPGGTVLVTGKKASSYRSGYETVKIGSASSKNSIISTGTADFKLNGSGKLENKSDKLTFAGKTAQNAVSVSGNIKGDGSAALMIRAGTDKSSSFYAVIVNGGKLSVTARKADGGKTETLAKADCTDNTYVKIVRTGENTFTAFTADSTDGNLDKWTEIKESGLSFSMGNTVYYGFAPLSGKTVINGLTSEDSDEKVYSDSFDGKTVSSVFENVNADFVSIADGALSIKNTKNETLHYLLTESVDFDWTFKTETAYKPASGTYAGVVCMQDENDYIIVGRTADKDSQKLFLGRYMNGTMAIYGSVSEAEPGGSVIVQLQRISGYYTAVYSYDNGKTWSYIGRVFSNYADERVGLLVSGATDASFNWVSFGDYINDGVSVNTPYSPVNVDANFVDVGDECKYEYLTGDWSLVTGGWAQTNIKGFAQASAVNRTFDGLYAEATVEITEGNGWAGLAFGKSAYDSNENDGFMLKYHKDGKLVLEKSGKVLSETIIKDSADSLRIVVNADSEAIYVYAGQEVKSVMTVENPGYSTGYVSFCTDGAAAEFRNMHHGATNASWLWVNSQGGGAGRGIHTMDTSTSQRQLHTVATLLGYSFTDFVCTARLFVSQDLDDIECASGLLLCASAGQSADEDGAFVYIDGQNNLAMRIDGKEVAKYALTGSRKSVLVMVVKQQGNYKVYINGTDTPVMEYSEKFNRGGVLSVYTINGFGGFTKLDIENLQPEQELEASRIYGGWKGLGSGVMTENFNTDTAKNAYCTYYQQKGTFEVKNGALCCTESSGWEAGVTLTEDIYSDFIMEFKAAIHSNESGWMSVGLRKDKATATHTSASFSLMITSSGKVYFYIHNKKLESKAVSDGQISNFSRDKWYDVKIVAKGSSVIAYVDGTQMAVFDDKDYREGFISFTSGMTEYSVDDLKITPLS